MKNASGQHRIGTALLHAVRKLVDIADAARCDYRHADRVSHGGRKNVGLDLVRWAAEMAQRGAGEILLTSMDKDGTRSGFDLELTRAVSDAIPVPVIASGGVGNLDHLADGVQQGGADAVLAASIFHYGEYTVLQAKQHMAARGIPVRL